MDKGPTFALDGLALAFVSALACYQVLDLVVSEVDHLYSRQIEGLARRALPTSCHFLLNTTKAFEKAGTQHIRICRGSWRKIA